MLLSLVFSACQTEDNSKDSNSSELDSTFDFKELTNSNIGIDKNGEIELKVSSSKIMETFINYNRIHNPELKPQSFEVVKLDDAHYLRFHSEHNLVSTIALIKDDANQYITGTTICETTACVSGGGCVPNGQYCTKCVMENGLPDDCKRTTIGHSD